MCGHQVDSKYRSTQRTSLKILIVEEQMRHLVIDLDDLTIHKIQNLTLIIKVPKNAQTEKTHQQQLSYYVNTYYIATSILN